MKKKNKKKAWYIILAVLGLLLAAALPYFTVTPFLTLELRAPLPSAEDIAGKNAQYKTEYAGVQNEKGTHVLFVKRGHGFLYVPVVLKVDDTASPTAEAARDVVVPLGGSVGPDQLLQNIEDNDIVMIRFVDEADFQTIGDHVIDVVLEDPSGNTTTVSCPYAVRGLVDGLSMEAGEALPMETEYLICDPVQTKARMISEYPDDMVHHAGAYPIVFSFSVEEGKWQEEETCLTVSDTVPPRGEGTVLKIHTGDTIAIEDFIAYASDETDLRYEYVQAPNFDCFEQQDVIVRIVDEGGNAVEVTSKLTISSLDPIQIEARTTALTAADFGTEKQVQVEPFIPDTVGEFLVDVEVDGHREAVLVTVSDTTPPVISPHAGIMDDLYTHHPMTAEELFSVQDVSETTLRYGAEIDWTQEGLHSVAVVAADAYGNEAEYSTEILLKKDDMPPVLYGVTDRMAYVGEPIAYFFGVLAVDDVDTDIRIDVDSKVDMHQKGKYDVIYTATDVSGNATSQKCVFTLIEPTVTDEEIRDMAREVMASITTEDMVTAEKLKAIFEYVRAAVVYGNGINKNYTDWRKGAYDGFTKGKGDCYNIWAVTRALLDQLDGVEYMNVTRINGRTRHYWCIVNMGTGWYHFDPTNTRYHKAYCFMQTNEQCNSPAYYYWKFDMEKFPSIATEEFDYEKIVQMEKEGLIP